jgi:very-short-patch-repair endonuclease
LKILYSKDLKQRSRELINNSTLAEVLLWNQLKRRKMLGYQFMRQKPIHHFIVDFYCSKMKLVIEIDGESHGFGLVRTDDDRSIWSSSDFMSCGSTIWQLRRILAMF